MSAPRSRTPLVALLAVGLLLAVPALALAYSKPPGGKWNIQDSFDRTAGGAMTLSQDGTKLTKLVLNSGEDYVEDCGATVRLASQPKLKSFKKASGRWAIGRQPNSLIEPISVKVKVAGQTKSGTLVMLFDQSGRLANSAEVEFGDCQLSFFARKAR